MPRSKGLTHVAMSVARGTLSDEYVAAICDFYGEHLGWEAIDLLRQEDRLTLAVGGRTYINIRERDDVMVCHGYEHLGITLGSAADVDELWHHLRADSRDLEVSELQKGEDGFRALRFRYLLPMTVEVQYFPSSG